MKNNMQKFGTSAANSTPLSPLSFLRRAAKVYPTQPAVVHGGETATAAEIIAYCRENMAHFKAPKHIVLSDLPKTSTGKIK